MSALTRTIHRAWHCTATPAATRFRRATANPREQQERLLLNLVSRNATTEFGREHGFDRIFSMQDFRARVPVRNHEELSPWIEAAAHGKPSVLTRDPVLRFLPTSGSITGRKLIPWTISLQREFQEAIRTWIHGFMSDCPTAWHGRVFWSISPPTWSEERTRGGIPIGFDSDTSYLGRITRPLIEKTFAVPATVATIRDAESWRYTTLAFLLAAGDLSLLSIWSPSFLSALLESLPGWWAQLLEDLESGTLSPPGVHGDDRNVWAQRLGRHRRRALALRHRSPLMPGEIWPHLACISCWTDAGARAPSRLLADLFPRTRIVGKGLIATEGIVSIPLSASAPPALALTSHVLEFMQNDGRVCSAWELEAGGEYIVILTNGGGLYRYRLGDRIRVSGYMNRCPTIEFIGREGITSDLCGEKLTEPFVRNCLDQTACALQTEFPFALMAPVKNGHAHYALYFSTNRNPPEAFRIEDTLDPLLEINVHYGHARRIGQLKKVRAIRLNRSPAEAWQRYLDRYTSLGIKIGDIKPVALDTGTDWDHWLVGSSTFSSEDTP